MATIHPPENEAHRAIIFFTAGIISNWLRTRGLAEWLVTGGPAVLDRCGFGMGGGVSAISGRRSSYVVPHFGHL